MAATPTLINLPPPPSDPVTPSDVPSRSGTPNSTTTSMSELSTVAIKDGHRGHLPHHHHHGSNPMDVERADRISRLAGLERVPYAARQSSNLNPSAAGSSASPALGQQLGSGAPPTQGYFDANNQPQIMRERSTVGSASATGSVGGRTTTWASGSDSGAGTYDRMSETQDHEMDITEPDTSSMGGFSDEGAASLVGFGEGARTPARQHSVLGSPVLSKANPAATAAAAPSGSAVPSHLRDTTPVSRDNANTPGSVERAKMIDGMTYDAGVVDTANRTPPPVGEAPERQMDGVAFGEEAAGARRE